MKSHDSIILGRYLVSLAVSKQKPLNMTKLQKLMFILYGYYLAQKGHHIIDEHPQAWPFGPVFPRVHKGVDYTTVTPLTDACFNDIREDADLLKNLDSVIEAYVKYSATQLSNWSHMEGSPWDRTTQLPGFKWSREIPDDYIKDYFSRKKVI
jgi:uncharacterized phage-associated protein